MKVTLPGSKLDCAFKLSHTHTPARMHAMNQSIEATVNKADALWLLLFFAADLQYP